MATAKKSFGTLLNREDTPASGTYTVVGGMQDISYPEIQTDVEDSTDMQAAGAFTTVVPTVNRLSPISFSLFFDQSDASQESFITDQLAQSVINYQIVGVDAGAETQVFAAYVTSFKIVATVKGLTEANVTLTPTGAPTRS